MRGKGKLKKLCLEALLEDKDHPLRFEFHLDKLNNWPYKNPAVSVRGGKDAEEAYYQEIYVRRKGRSAEPISDAFATNDVLNGLGQPWGEVRFHDDRKMTKNSLDF